MDREQTMRAHPRVLRWVRIGLSCLAVLCAPAWTSPSPALAQTGSTAVEAEARDSFARGRAAYDAGDFDIAAQAFEQAYALSGKSGLLYNLYLAFRDANRQEQAAGALRAYLEKDAQVPNRPQLEARLKALEAGLHERQRAAEESARTAAAAVALAPAPPVLAPVEVAPEGERRAWWVGPVAVMGGGGVLMLASIIPGTLALHKASELKSACTDDLCSGSLRSVEKERKTLALTSDVLLFGGIATAAAGAVWFFVKRVAHERPPVTAACTRFGCSAAFTSQF